PAIFGEARRAAVEHPAVLAVAPAQAILDLEGLARVEGAHAGVEPAAQVLGVHALRPAVPGSFLGAAARERQPRRTSVRARQIRAHGPEHRRRKGVGAHDPYAAGRMPDDAL